VTGRLDMQPGRERGVFRVKPKRPPHTPEAKENIRAAVSRHWANPAARARQSDIVKRRMVSPEVRKLISRRTREGIAASRGQIVPVSGNAGNAHAYEA
jgi:hypothetical protein